jgi:hypothetical protein
MERQMADAEPRIVVRMGSHSEKDYILKVSKFLDGIVVGANLVEATPGATASLLAMKFRQPYFIDPMTYVYACDVNWIKSQQASGKSSFKRSYRALADRLGPVFRSVIEKQKPISLSDLSKARDQTSCAEGVLEYQLRRLREEFEQDEGYADFAGDIPEPTALFAPYFHIPANRPQWLDIVLGLCQASVEIDVGRPVHSVICADRALLSDRAFVKRVETEIPTTGVAGVWLRFMDLNELEAQEGELRALRGLVESLSGSVEVNNMHGGYFSLALSKYGLRTVSHGVGYGERKSLEPIIGVVTPTVRYYLPDVHRMFGVPEIERCFTDLGVVTPADFHNRICNCLVCKGVVAKNIAGFHEFGDQHYARSDSKRRSQTPAAAKRCRFHFLFSRIRERDSLKSASLRDICIALQDAREKWGDQPAIAENTLHIARWKKVLEAKASDS